jgi:hypothetical protein
MGSDSADSAEDRPAADRHYPSGLVAVRMIDIAAAKVSSIIIVGKSIFTKSKSHNAHAQAKTNDFFLDLQV